MRTQGGSERNSQQGREVLKEREGKRTRKRIGTLVKIEGIEHFF